MSNDQLRIARSVALEDCKHIGEPLISIPTDHLFVSKNEDGSPRVSMRMDHFIELAERMVEPTPQS